MNKYSEIAEQLRIAYKTAPMSSIRNLVSGTDINAAYQIQALNTAYWIGQGRKKVGHKIGLTAEVVQKQLGVDRPDFGILFEDMWVKDGAELSSKALLQPKVEAEIAFILSEDLNKPNITGLDVIQATSYLLPALEIVDSRILDWNITFADTVADNASSAYFVLGTSPKSIHDVDLRHCGMSMEFSGKVVSHGCGVACLGNPLEAVAWLARALYVQGDYLKAGDIVLSGALGPMASLQSSTYVQTFIAGLGHVGFNYTQDDRDDRD